MEPRFDEHQFGGLGRSSFKNLNANYAFADTNGRMGYFKRVGRSSTYIPGFVLNDLQLRQVLITAALGYARKHHESIDDPAKEFQLVAQMTAEWSIHLNILAEGSDKPHWERLREHLKVVETTGGYMAFITAVAYRAWRLRWPSRDIASELEIKPQAVRNVLTHLKFIAEGLGFETYQFRGTHALTETQHEAILAAWKSGMSVPEITASTGICGTAIKRFLRAECLFTDRRHFKRHRIPREHVEEMVRLSREGLTASEISRRLPYCLSRVLLELKRSGVFVSRAWRKYDESEIAALIGQGLSTPQIASRVNCAEETVRRTARFLRTIAWG